MVFGVSIILIDRFLYKAENTFVLYMLIPILSIGLLFFDNESILRSARFIIIFPLLFALSYYIKNFRFSFLISIIIILLTHFIIQPNWASFYRNQINNESLIVNDLKDLKLNDINSLNFDENTYILDLWYSKCAVCYKNMEELEKWAKSNPEHHDNIFLVNILLEGEKFEKNMKLVEKYGFKSTYTRLSFEEFKELGVQTYPTQIVVKNNKIIFVGDLELNKNVILNNISDYLN